LIRMMQSGAMTVQAVSSTRARRKARKALSSPLAIFGALVTAAVGFVAYVLWPTWPTAAVALDAPTLPITVGDVLFQVPPAAIRATVQRHAGPQERLDLAFLWPSLKAPRPDGEANGQTGSKPLDANTADEETTGSTGKPTAGGASGRVFVTMSALRSLLPPIERLNSIYPQYVEAKAVAAADGLAVLAFRAGTPYEGEDLVYVAGNPEQFFARCSRQTGTVPGTCIHERVLGTADITLRFPRDWLDHWRDVAASFDQLIAQLHPQGK
jgi:hypothetical protein